MPSLQNLITKLLYLCCKVENFYQDNHCNCCWFWRKICKMRERIMTSMIQQLKVFQEVIKGAAVRLFLEAVIKELRRVSKYFWLSQFILSNPFKIIQIHTDYRRTEGFFPNQSWWNLNRLLCYSTKFYSQWANWSHHQSYHRSLQNGKAILCCVILNLGRKRFFALLWTIHHLQILICTVKKLISENRDNNYNIYDVICFDHLQTKPGLNILYFSRISLFSVYF